MTQKRKLNIAVVEDNLLYQQLIARQLELLCSSMVFYKSGEDCISDIINRQPELIVMDYNLAGEMTGLDTLKAIRALLPDVYVILFTDQHAISTAENMRLFGDFDFLEKSDKSFPILHEKVRESAIFLQKKNVVNAEREEKSSIAAALATRSGE